MAVKEESTQSACARARGLLRTSGLDTYAQENTRGFYAPLVLEVGGKMLIAYPCKGLGSALARRDKHSVERHLARLYGSNPALQHGDYHIVVLWADNGEVMADVNIYDLKWASGPLKYVRIFRDIREEPRDKMTGEGAGDEDILLGLEQLHSWQFDSIEDYMASARPELPGVLAAREAF